MHSLRRQFGKRLKTIRLERKLTPEQFAELVGISVDFLSLIERGINAPSFEVLERVGGALRMPVREFLILANGESPTLQSLKALKIRQTPWAAGLWIWRGDFDSRKPLPWNRVGATD